VTCEARSGKLRDVKRLAILPALLLPLVLWGCFEEPILERLRLRFLPSGEVEVTASVEIHDPPAGSESVTRRIRQIERLVETGEDPWSPRFRELDPGRETFRWEKREGQLIGAERVAWSEDPSRLTRFFGDTAVLAEYRREQAAEGLEGWASLALYPGPSHRANRRQAARVADLLESWTEDLAPYLEAAVDLYRYLENHPERATACLTAFYGDLLEEVEEPELTPDEEELVTALSNTIDGATAVLELDRDEGYSLNELSHLVYDPFPARVTVEVPGRVLEVEGFEPVTPSGSPAGPGSEGGPTELTIPGLGFWEAWLALEGVWIFPDPAVSAYYLTLREDPDAVFPELLAAERRVEPAPTPQEIRDAVESLLRPEPAYRVLWAETSDAWVPPGTPDTAGSNRR